jgi:hypothetical protein
MLLLLLSTIAMFRGWGRKVTLTPDMFTVSQSGPNRALLLLLLLRWPQNVSLVPQIVSFIHSTWFGSSYQHKHAIGVIHALQQLLLSWPAAAAPGI